MFLIISLFACFEADPETAFFLEANGPEDETIMLLTYIGGIRWMNTAPILKDGERWAGLVDSGWNTISIEQWDQWTDIIDGHGYLEPTGGGECWFSMDEEGCFEEPLCDGDLADIEWVSAFSHCPLSRD